MLLNLIKSVDSVFERHLLYGEFLSSSGDHIGIQGGVVSISNSNQLLFQKGYGYSDLERQMRFDPHRTTVHVASVAKMITAVATMKLVQDGRLNLDNPIDSYLKCLPIENRYSQKILVKHLLTHSAGFDDNGIHSESIRARDLIPLQAYLESNLPPVVWSPGEFYNYSNYGFSLLAYLVQVISEESFNDFVLSQVLTPVGMNRSGFSNQKELLQNLMTRYRWTELKDGTGWKLEEVGVKFSNRIGSSGFKTTASDMSSFGQMFLKALSNDSSQILSFLTVKEMLTPKFTYDSLFDVSAGLGWRIEKMGKNFVYTHYGDDVGIESSLILIPSEDLTVFVDLNNSDGATVRKAVNQTIRKFFRNKRINQTEEKLSVSKIRDVYTGKYQYMNDSQYSFERVRYLFGEGLVDVQPIDSESIWINDLKYDHLGRNFYMNNSHNRQAKFFQKGDISYYSSGLASYRQLNFFEEPKLHRSTLLGSLIVLLSTLSWPISWSWQKLMKKSHRVDRPRMTLALTSGLLLTFIVLFGILTDTLELKYGVPTSLKFTFILPLLGVASLLYSLWSFFRDKDTLSLVAKAHYGIGVFSMILVLAIFEYYNLLGFNF